MRLTIDTDPIPKGRPRFTRSGHVYTAKRTRDYEKLIGLSYRANGGKAHSGPVSVELVFYVSRMSDIDNLVKAVLDGLNGVAWVDDRQVCRLMVDRIKDPNPRIEMIIERITTGPDETKGEA